MNAAAWPQGVKQTFKRQGYSRKPEDVVSRRQVEKGPPLRRLMFGSAHQQLNCQLMLRRGPADQFDLWRIEVLDYGQRSFDLTLFDHPAPRQVRAHFRNMPQAVWSGPNSRTYALELMLEAPAPSQAQLAALAALDKAGPATWPASLPQAPLRQGYASQPESRVMRGTPTGPVTARLMGRQEGWQEDVRLHLTASQLQTFEQWFAVDAALGVRDINWPVAGGVHIGCFSSAYTVEALADEPRFAVSFKRYLEAVK